MNQLINTILESRGYQTEEQKNEFFSSDLRELPDLTEMKDMKKASLRIIEAIKNDETVGIYGDYDVDGTTSCALFYQFFKMLKIKTEVIQPSRFIDGYGVHKSSIDKALSKNVSLLITVDCGITNHETADYAKDKLDLIITDHHHGKETNPDAYAIVNPNRADEKDSKLKNLAGVGVAFAVCLSVKRLLEENQDYIPSIYPLLQYVAIGTISDLATLNPMNIKLVRHGLKQITNTKFKGVKVFFSDEELKKGIQSQKIAFNVGPMINAIGRLDHPEIAFKLLVCNSDIEALKLYSKLAQSNTERKKIQQNVEREAQSQINQNLKKGNASVNIVYKKDWHEGVIGIAASKLVQNNKKPALVFCDAEEDGVIKASCRSVADYDLFSQLKKCSDLFIKFGGHQAAAGLSMKKENLPKLRKKLNYLMKSVDFEDILRRNKNLWSINLKDVSLLIAKEISLLEPFGMGNQMPMFSVENFEIVGYTVLREAHVKWTLKSKDDENVILEGISFNFINKVGVKLPEEYVEEQVNFNIKAQAQINVNVYRNKEKVQLLIDDFYLDPKEENESVS